MIASEDGQADFHNVTTFLFYQNNKMEKLADLSMFESLLENDRRSTLTVFNPGLPDGSSVENTGINFDSDRIMPPQPTQAASNDSRFTPEWKKTVDERLGSLERNMATKSDIQRIETLLKNR